MVIPVPNRMYVTTDFQYYVQGQAVRITGRTELFLPGKPIDFEIKDNSGTVIWRKHCDQPFNHGGYVEVEPSLNIFNGKHPYYSVTGTCDGMSDTVPFSYY